MIPAEYPSITLVADDGARADIALDGAHVVSWTPAGETENRLFVSTRSHYGPGTSIRGGIPVIFPQFGKFGELQQHGFARNRRWSVVDGASAGGATLRLADDNDTRAMWPHRFKLTVDVQVAGDTLSIAMHVVNTDTAPFTFTAAFHPYFAMQNAFDAHVDGLAGCAYRDALRDGAIDTERDASLVITGALDRVYYEAPDALIVRDSTRTLHITKRGFPEAVVWNPGDAGTLGRDDFVPGDERHMLCVEAARIATPVMLAAGERWTGEQVIRAS